MNIEDEIFKKTKLNIDKLTSYGFVKKSNIYQYSKVFMNDFRADIVIDKLGNVTGKVYDLNMDEEYISFRIEDQSGEFVNSVREGYKDILRDIRDNCFLKLYFISAQANRICNRIVNLYHNEPEFLWEKSLGHGVFRSANNQKWYGIIMNIDKGKLDKKSSGEVEVINVKLDTFMIDELLKRPGFYPSYHMNKKNWITIILDDSLTDDEIMEYVGISHKYTETPDEWIVPANPKYYDVINCFNDREVVEWKQSNDIKAFDIVYLYVAAPYSAILYKCEAIEVNIPYEYKDKNLSMNRVMKLRLLKRYDKDQYPFSKLNECGVKAIRGPRSVPKQLSEELNK